jgi:hypothetical protein
MALIPDESERHAAHTKPHAFRTAPLRGGRRRALGSDHRGGDIHGGWMILRSAGDALFCGGRVRRGRGQCFRSARVRLSRRSSPRLRPRWTIAQFARAYRQAMVEALSDRVGESEPALIRGRAQG